MIKQRLVLAAALLSMLVAVIAGLYPHWIGTSLTSIPTQFDAGHHLISWDPPIDEPVSYRINHPRQYLEAGGLLALSVALAIRRFILSKRK